MLKEWKKQRLCYTFWCGESSLPIYACGISTYGPAMTHKKQALLQDISANTSKGSSCMQFLW